MFSCKTIYFDYLVDANHISVTYNLCYVNAVPHVLLFLFLSYLVTSLKYPPSLLCIQILGHLKNTLLLRMRLKLNLFKLLPVYVPIPVCVKPLESSLQPVCVLLVCLLCVHLFSW